MSKVIVNDKRGMDSQARKERQFPKQLTAEAKRYIIISMVAEGKTYSEILNHCVDAWGLGLKTIQNIINETLEYMRSDAAKESLTAMNTERLENIISESMREGDRKSAVKAIDIQNKMNGAYTENIKLDTDNDINLHFEI